MLLPLQTYRGRLKSSFHDCVQEYNDAMLTVYLSSITKGTQSALDLIDKYTVAYDRSTSHRRRGPAFEPGFMHG